jgi:hypothetical protein
MSDTINKSVCIRVEKVARPNDSDRSVYIFKCASEDCDSEIRIRSDALKTHSYHCSAHSHRKRPFESIYHSLRNDWRKLPNTLTYEDYLEFTKVSNCTYCKCIIPWNPYSTIKGNYGSRAHFLDRKDSKLGYSVSNCVVCCTICNKIKGNHLTHDEMLVAMEAVLKLRNA